MSVRWGINKKIKDVRSSLACCSVAGRSDLGIRDSSQNVSSGEGGGEAAFPLFLDEVGLSFSDELVAALFLFGGARKHG